MRRRDGAVHNLAERNARHSAVKQAMEALQRKQQGLPIPLPASTQLHNFRFLP